jgi:hypothetical protein
LVKGWDSERENCDICDMQNILNEIWNIAPYSQTKAPYERWGCLLL